MVFTKHETRNTKHGFFFSCFGRHVVRNAGQVLYSEDLQHGFGIDGLEITNPFMDTL